MKINKIIELSSAFSAEVNVYRDFKYVLDKNDKFLDGYLPNRSSRKIISSIFDTLSSRDDRKLHLITASYGTGKSYLLLILAYLLGNKNIDFLNELHKKIADKELSYEDGLSKHLESHWDNKSQYLIVVPPYGNNDFEQGMLSSLNHALVRNGINYLPVTHYLRAAQLLELWRNTGNSLYEQFQANIPGKRIEDFVNLLKDCDSAAYDSFKPIYKAIVGTEFSEAHGDVYEAFRDTAKHISTLGYKGIVTIYDEFGGILGRLINKSLIDSTIKIQDFLEKVKEKNEPGANLIFLAASHQDPNTLKEDKQQRIDKVLGRFETYRLEVADAESEELIGKVFITLDKKYKDEVLTSDYIETNVEMAKELRLYPTHEEAWFINRILKDLYPLHPLTAFILPRLSNQFAQNSRSMFNFLSPDEPGDGSLKRYIDSQSSSSTLNKKLNLFTPDRLLDYFRPNLEASAMNNLVEAFDLVLGKIDDEVIKRLMQNILILSSVRRKEVMPTYEVLLWAMHDQNGHSFGNLMNDLVNDEILELNPISHVYEFPQLGTKNFSKVLEEEKKKLQDLNLFSCRDRWIIHEPPTDYDFLDYNSTHGSNRAYKTLFATSVEQFEAALHTLDKHYTWVAHDGTSQGLVVHLLVQDEESVESYGKKLAELFPNLGKYIIFAKPKEAILFEPLIKSTINFVAYVNAASNPEISSNPSHNAKLTLGHTKAHSELSNEIRKTFSPENWLWSFNEMKAWDEIKNARSLGNSMELYISELFSSSPVIKDDALWFGKATGINATNRVKALGLIMDAEQNRIPVENNGNNSAENRIVTNFFNFTNLSVAKKTVGKIHFGEILLPVATSQIGKIWSFIDKTLVVDKIVDLNTIVKPLLEAPFGLSEHIIKFILGCFVRYYNDIIIIAEIKRPASSLSNRSAIDFDEFFKKPHIYGIRKIEMSSFEKRYVRQLISTFDKENNIPTFQEVARKLEHQTKFFTPLSYALIKDNTEVFQLYKNCIIPFLEKLKEIGANRELDAKEFFLEILPSHILEVSSREEFENDQENIPEVVKQFNSAREYPLKRETEFRLEVLRNLAAQVFDATVATAEEFKKIVKNWFDKLPPNNRTMARSENPMVMRWLNSLRIDENVEATRFYLEDLSSKNIKDWTEPLIDTIGLITKLKEYKQEIESYTKNPIEEYQSIARSCFSVSSLECNSEEIFIGYFNHWWSNLPALNKEAHYEDEQVNIFINEFKSSASVKNRFLIQIPTKWKDASFLKIFNVDWENWDRTEASAVAKLYYNCIDTISKWEPPLAESKLVNGLSNVFKIDATDNFDELTEILIVEWLEKLPLNTRNGNFASDSKELLFLKSLDSRSIRNVLLIDLVHQFKLKEFIFWNEKDLDEYLLLIESIKNKIEAYRRSYLEIIAQLELRLKQKSSSVAEYRSAFKDKLILTAAYKNKADDQGDEFITLLGRTMLKGTRKLYSDKDFEKLINDFAKVLNIAEDYHFWTDETQLKFAREFDNTIKYLKDWVFPEEQMLLTAKDKIAEQISSLQVGLKISDFQLLKILSDLIEERSEKVI